MQHEALSFDLDHTKLVAIALKRHAALLISKNAIITREINLK